MDYFSAARDIQIENTVKKSKFICYVHPTDSTEKAHEFLEKIRKKHKDMPKARKMLSDWEAPYIQSLMKLIETQSKATLAFWAVDYAERVGTASGLPFMERWRSLMTGSGLTHLGDKSSNAPLKSADVWK